MWLPLNHLFNRRTLRGAVTCASIKYISSGSRFIIRSHLSPWSFIARGGNRVSLGPTNDGPFENLNRSEDRHSHRNDRNPESGYRVVIRRILGYTRPPH